jgi:hypothetical protein
MWLSVDEALGAAIPTPVKRILAAVAAEIMGWTPLPETASKCQSGNGFNPLKRKERPK